jgi:APA family basic amino acid/polyamine antiporter
MFATPEFTITRGQLVGVAVILVLTLYNTLGITAGKWLQNIFTVAKIGSLAALIVAGLTITVNPVIRAANSVDPWGDIADTKSFVDMHALFPSGGALLPLMVVGGALVGALFSADAWNNVTFTAGEVRNPERNLPLSLMFGTGLVIGLYLLANVAYLSTLPVQANPDKRAALAAVHRDKDAASPQAKLIAESATVAERGIEYARDDRVGTAVLELVTPGYGVTVMAIAIMISTFGCQNGLILMGARLTYAMARDGLFFKAVGGLNRRGVPAVALWLQAVWASALVFSGTYNDLLDYVIFAALLFYALTVLGLFVLRFRQPDAPRPYRAVGYPVLPALYVGLSSAVMLDLLIVKPLYTWPGLLLVLTGIPVYFLWKMNRLRHKRVMSNQATTPN